MTADDVIGHLVFEVANIILSLSLEQQFFLVVNVALAETSCSYLIYILLAQDFRVCVCSLSTASTATFLS